MAKRRGGTKQQLTPRQMAVLLVLCVAAAAIRWYFQPEPVSLEDIPEWNGAAYVELEDNQPGFTKEEMTLEAFEHYSELDYLGRCGVAYANICPELMPTEEREAIGSVKPTGWVSAKYDCVDGKYLYNRCHLIGFQLAGENANEKNLITGTRYLNVTGMLPFENDVADYVRRTDNHVLYRVTPVFVERSWWPGACRWRLIPWRTPGTVCASTFSPIMCSPAWPLNTPRERAGWRVRHEAVGAV